MRRRIRLALPLALLLALAAGSPRPAVAAEVFVDDAGRSVRIEGPIARVLPAGPPADLLLFALAPDRLVGLVHPWTTEQKPAVPAPWRELPIVPRLTPDPMKVDLDGLRALGVDLVVDYGDLAPKYVVAADRANAVTGLPAILMDGRIRATPSVLRRLGRLLDRAAEGERLAAVADDALARLAPLAEMPDDARVPVYLARGSDGLDAVAAGTTLDEAIGLAGGRNVVPAGGSFRLLRPEEVAALAPRVVIVEDAEAARPDGPLRRALPAATVFLVDDFHGFHLMENPPSLNRLVGAARLAGTLHPGATSIDDAGVADLARRLLRLEAP